MKQLDSMILPVVISMYPNKSFLHCQYWDGIVVLKIDIVVVQTGIDL